MIDGVTDIINVYGKVIVLEDDLITTPYFLTFMNNMLNLHENDEFWSISGYVPNLKNLKKYNQSIFTHKRASSWGWGTWKRMWDLNDWQIHKTTEISVNNIFSMRELGNDFFYMLYMQKIGVIDSWAVRWCENQRIREMKTIYPTNTFIKNIGLDGSGTHGSYKKTRQFEINDKKSMNELKKDYINYYPFVDLRDQQKINNEFKNLYGNNISFIIYYVKFLIRKYVLKESI